MSDLVLEGGVGDIEVDGLVAVCGEDGSAGEIGKICSWYEGRWISNPGGGESGTDAEGEEGTIIDDSRGGERKPLIVVRLMEM